MNKSYPGRARVTIVAAAVAAILAGCASMPKTPPGSEAVRSKLTALKSQPQLAAQVPVVLEQAEKAVVLAETPQPDAQVAAHRVYLADRLVDTARATAETRLAEAQRAGLKQQSDDARLAARTREADAAQRAAEAARSDAASSRVAAENSRLAVNSALNAASTARAEADSARADANVARTEADTARNQAESARARAEAERVEADAARMATEAARVAAESAAAAAAARSQQLELERQIALLQAKTTERGIVLTLGDVLFASGSDQLKPGAVGHLDRLVAFMGTYVDRLATIEGHTDSLGEEGYNQSLSQRRADAVKTYLAGRGVAPTRLTSIGKGETYPIAGNESAGGRQQNRRVEVVIVSDMKSVAQLR
jgi:outer membrane protein OmpA-like peptidoglycan-associated protein